MGHKDEQSEIGKTEVYLSIPPDISSPINSNKKVTFKSMTPSISSGVSGDVQNYEEGNIEIHKPSNGYSKPNIIIWNRQESKMSIRSQTSSSYQGSFRSHGSSIRSQDSRSSLRAWQIRQCKEDVVLKTFFLGWALFSLIKPFKFICQAGTKNQYFVVHQGCKFRSN